MLNPRTMMSAESVYSEIQKLDEEERSKLDRLLGIAPDPDIEAAWIAESKRRFAEHDAGNMKSVPWVEARERIFAKP